MSRFVVIILDGFGIGAMDDVPEVRPADQGANTFLHILEANPNMNIPTLERLGLMNFVVSSVNTEISYPDAVYGCANLMHFGADTFFGHQEIMGTLPTKPFQEPIKRKLAIIEKTLVEHGYKVKREKVLHESFLFVDDCVSIGDNLECDLGQAFNVTASLDLIPFDKVIEIGNLVRSVSVIPRVIVFAGRSVSKNDILNAKEEIGEYAGVNAPKSGVYNKDYHCIHLGHGVDLSLQLPMCLSKQGVPVFLIGKVADVVQNPHGYSLPLVPTAEVLAKTKEIVEKEKTAFICANVQETDLSGHLENSTRYASFLEIADKGIASIISKLDADDILVVMADHGNDPLIGHPHHTREKVPLLIYCNKKGINIGERSTLSDIAATVACFFNATAPQNGTAILEII